MTDLSKLKVSLTKHGAHKIADLLKEFPNDQILGKTWDAYQGIKIDRAQSVKNLSADSSGNLPSIWEKVQELDEDQIDNLVFLAIIFSHHELISAMKQAQTGEMKGTVKRGEVIDGKAFTNFACVIDELRFSTQHNPQEVSYSLNRLFEDEHLPSLIRQLLAIKLKQANWDGQSDLIDECVTLGLHQVFAIDEADFREWLSGSAQPIPQPEESEEAEELPDGGIRFTSGHAPRQQGSLERKPRTRTKKARLLHNEIQNKLHSHLVSVYGENVVGTEVASGGGTSIDIVLKQTDGYIFYEIKTDESIRLCFRQAISQLMEYAYWPNTEKAKKLVIVSTNSITNQAKEYLLHLRTKFGLPLYYQRFNMDSDSLDEIV